MHIITKFLVVLASVLAILLAGLTVAYTANHAEVVDRYNAAQQEIITQTARAESAERNDVSSLANLNDQVLALRTAESAAVTTNARLQGELEQSLSDLQQLRLETQRHQNQIDQFIELSKQDKRLRDLQQEELVALREEVNNQARRLIDLLDRNSDLTSELEGSQNQVRALAEQIADLRRGGSGSTGFAALPDNFRARVTNVLEDADGSTLIEINAGSSDRLSEGMELIVTRGSAGFLGKIELVRVDLNEAVGRVILPGNGSIRNNDEIRPAA